MLLRGVFKYLVNFMPCCFQGRSSRTLMSLNSVVDSLIKFATVTLVLLRVFFVANLVPFKQHAKGYFWLDN